MPLHYFTHAIRLTVIWVSILYFTTHNAYAQKEVTTALQQLTLQADKYQLSTADINNMTISSQYLSPTTGWYHLYFNQTVQQIEVYNSLICVTLLHNEVANINTNFVINIQSQLQALSTDKIMQPYQAMVSAIRSVDASNNVSAAKQISVSTLANGDMAQVIFENKSVSDNNIIVKKYWLPTTLTIEQKTTQAVVLIWNVKYLSKDGNHSWSIHVNANTGAIIDKIDEVVHCQFDNPTNHISHSKATVGLPHNNISTPAILSPTANGYTVFDYPLESPNHGTRTLVSNPYTRFLPATMGPGATNGWHNDGTTNYSSTRGNSVWAKDDIAADNEATIGSNPTSGSLDFNYPYTQATGTAAANLNAAITNLYYWCNINHDVLWRYGFDEPSGNFQKDNMGKGGLANDFVFADAQDGNGIDNANFNTPVDGTNPRMQMYIWSNAGSPTYQPDSDFDNGIIAHEYGHGWSTRLTGGPAISSCLQNSEQGGEGWSDYNGLMLTTNWAALTPTIASANIPRAIGTYVEGQSPTTGAGIRPYRYSYNKAVVNNVVTYGKVADAANFSIPHGIGSIWATMLWDMTWEIILQDNIIVPNIYDVPTVITDMRGNVAAYKLVTEGLRLQACSPSLVQSRDAIFQADRLLFGGRYKCAIGKAFARRGLGPLATTGSSTNDRVITEDFTSFSFPTLSSATRVTTCSNQIFTYTTTVSTAGSYSYNWSRAAVAGISNASGTGNTSIISETLINTTNEPIAVVYLITVGPNDCGGAITPQSVTVTITPSVVPTVGNYSICQNSAVPAGQGLIAPTFSLSLLNGNLTAASGTYNRGTGTTTYVAATAGTSGATVYYTAYTFTSPLTASVSFATTAANLSGLDPNDTYLAIYQTSFNPAAPATNFLRADDDAGLGSLSQFTQALVQGSTYVIVVSSYSNTITGSFTLEASSAVFVSINQWYLNATGGSILASTNTFNPTVVPGSGLSNTTIASSTTYYVSNNIYPSCRTATTFTIIPTILYVNQANVSGTYNGLSWGTAYTTLQQAINTAPTCLPLQIWVAAGTYTPTNISDRNISFSLKNNVAIYGGFANTGAPSFGQRNIAKNVTLLSGNIGVANDATDNSYHVINNTIELTSTSILDGFTIANGFANGATNITQIGAGLLNDVGGASSNCSPTIRNCTFINNYAMLAGGAIYNQAQNGTASPSIINCVFQQNTAPNGAAIYTATQAAGITNLAGINCTFLNNIAANTGSVLYATNAGGNAAATLTNAILWGNEGSKSLFADNATIQLSHTLVEPTVTNYTSIGNNIISEILPFITANSITLSDASIAIDAGTSFGAPLTDAVLAARLASPDMGAIENIQSCLGSPKIYHANLNGDSYQWQKNDGTGYVNITDGTLFGNTNTNKLTLLSPADNTTGTLYRCAVTANTVLTYSNEITLRFYNRWLGTVDNNWLNPLNWSCGSLPNQYIDVIVPGQKSIYPLTNVAGTVRTLQADNGSSIRVSAGNSLVIVGQ